MPQNAEAAAFLSRVAQLPPGPGVSLDDVLKPSLEDEGDLRKLFAQDKTNSRLSDKYVGLVDVFDAPSDIRTTRARVVASEEDLNAKYIMPLSEERRRKEGTPAMVDNLDDFKKNWAIFTENSLSQLIDWNNVIAAGGSVQACLAPVPDSAKTSKRALRKYFHSRAFPTSDVDLFLYGLTPEQAEVKINAIYEAVRDSIPWDVTCIRTKHTVSIHSQYPYRAVQIVLRLYQSPAEVLAGFDVDAPCCAFDGERVWANPRAIVAMMRQCNTVDVTRRSPSYEVRLSKYSARDFEVYVPQLNRADIDPTIFERSIMRIQGLARLLVLEKLRTAQDRENYLQSRRRIRGRPHQQDSWRRLLRKKYKGDLKADVDEGLEMSDYDVVSLHIPYGPGWDARRIDKLVYQTDLGMNSPYNPKNKGRNLHRHAAFFGTMPECLEDCCEHCPKPKNAEERELQEEEDKNYIRGRVQFIVEDAGRQSISGSFNPIDDGEWSEQAYIGITEKFFNAIAAQDRAAVAAAIKDGIDVNRRDHVGRTPLQVAIFSKSVEVACDLVDAGARMTARLVDGRTALHLAAQLNLPDVVRKLLERSAVNDEEAKAAAEKAAEEKAKVEEEKADEMEVDDAGSEDIGDDDSVRSSSEDDWSSEEDDGKKKKDAKEDSGDLIPDDPEDEPDVFQIDVTDWDYSLSALDYAVASGSIAVVELLLAAGADPKLVTKPKHSYSVNFAHPLILTAVAEEDDKACQAMEKLVAAGAVASEADDSLLTIFHRSVYTGRPRLVYQLLKSDPNAKVVLDFPWMDNYSSAVYPVVSAVNGGFYSVLAVLLAHGAKVVISRDDFQRARDMKIKNNGQAPAKFLTSTFMPVETALANYDEVVHLLIALGAEINLPTKESLRWGADNRDTHFTALDYARIVISKVDESVKFSESNAAPAHSKIIPVQNSPQWKLDFIDVANKYGEEQSKSAGTWGNYQQVDYLDEVKTYFDEVAEDLLAHQAKTGGEVFKSKMPNDVRIKPIADRFSRHYRPMRLQNYGLNWPFAFERHMLGARPALDARYEELFEACWSGDNLKIQKLCIPQPGRKSDPPLQISVHWGDKWRGITPLAVALHRRHWDTAKLIVTIASAQYCPGARGEKVVGLFRARMDIALDGESDDENEDNDDEDEEMEDQVEEINLVDIAKIPTDIQVDVAPTYMLSNVSFPFVGKDGKVYLSTVVEKAIIDDDFEAFVQILDLYSSLHQKDIPGHIMNSLITHDRPAMLDEFIRRTGQGITLKKEAAAASASSSAAETDGDSKAYLGLNVHGKKRKDLARKGDPNAPGTFQVYESLPMLWTAAQNGAMGVVRYLASDQPLAAYKYYASANGDARAKLIRGVADLGAVLPEKLGWHASHLNETVITAAIVGSKTDVVEALCSMRGKEIETMLHTKHRTLGFNSILAAVVYTTDIKLFDFLLSKGVSPLESDHNGWNILHHLCMGQTAGALELLKHVLRHLPKDITDRLLRQQTKEDRFTPLHIAVKKGRLDLVQVLVEGGASQYLVRNSGGSTPLHIAAKEDRPQIVKLLAESGPEEALTLEDGVGNTALETAARRAFIEKLDVACGNFRVPGQLQPNFHKKPFDLQKQEAQLPLFRATIDMLLRDGKLTAGTKLTKELLAFADRLEARIARERFAVEAKKQKEREEKGEVKAGEEGFTAEMDKGTASDVIKVLTEVLAARPTTRHLVHLADVHESVKKSLEKFSKSTEKQTKQTADDEGLPEDEELPTTSALTQGYDNSAQALQNQSYVY